MPASVTISLEELENLKNYLMKTGLKRVPVANEYELLRISDGDIKMVVYKSGKLVHNGSEETLKVIRYILQREFDYDYLVGSDEVGKGEWYGPLVVVCVALTPNQLLRFRELGVQDSKLLSKNQIKRLAAILDSETNRSRREVILMPETYNELYEKFKIEGKSLNDMLAWAHEVAINGALALVSPKKPKVVIDKFDEKKMDLQIERYSIKQPGQVIIQKSRGETEVPVAVASIIAKNLFETRVDELERRFNIKLRNHLPRDLKSSILPYVAKLHFKNVKDALI